MWQKDEKHFIRVLSPTLFSGHALLPIDMGTRNLPYPYMERLKYYTSRMKVRVTRGRNSKYIIAEIFEDDVTLLEKNYHLSKTRVFDAHLFYLIISGKDRISHFTGTKLWLQPVFKKANLLSRSPVMIVTFRASGTLNEAVIFLEETKAT